MNATQNEVLIVDFDIHPREIIIKRKLISKGTLNPKLQTSTVMWIILPFIAKTSKDMSWYHMHVIRWIWPRLNQDENPEF